MELSRSRYRGALLGLAVGDAVGAAVEFAPRGSFAPVTDLTGGGPWDLEPGQWTDDTSMALCLAESLVECGGFDAGDQMQRYVAWWKQGRWSCKGYCFDIGTTTGAALQRFLSTGEPVAGSSTLRSAGNGSIMRLAPVPMAFARDPAAALEWVAASSRTTHAAPEAVAACRFLALLLLRALHGDSRPEMLAPAGMDFGEAAIDAIARGESLGKVRESIHGSGYVVQSLEAALWCFARTASYREAVLLAANLGDDADTTAAVVGQLAGAHYGVEGIPAEWLEKVAMRGEIEGLADGLLELAARAA